MKRIVMLLCLVLLVVISYGCSDSSSDAPAAGDVHPANWLTTHGAEANDDLRSCQSCHGLDFNGSGDAVSCFSCHLGGPPFATHPPGWIDVRQDHQGFPLNYNWTGCATGACHGPTLQGGTVGPSCFNDSALCHVATNGDPPASHPLPYTSPSVHGIAGKDNLVYCQNCHGRPLNDFMGGYVADLFPDGSPEINDNGNCLLCHPDANAHPTNWTRNSNSRDRTHAASGNLETTCVICHNLTIDTTPGNNTPGPFPGAPSCYTVEFTNANGTTSSCHPDGPGTVPHIVGQAWLLPSGHVAAAVANDPDCFACHTLAVDAGGDDPACESCHTADDPLTLLNCTSCHNTPPDSQDLQGPTQPNLAGTHGGHVDFTATTADCSGCHVGGGTGSLTHYDRVDQTTPDYPAEVVFLPLYEAKTGGATSYNEAAQICDNISCHGGQISPDWTTGMITVASDCTFCHQLASVSDQYNSYSSGRHSSHAETGGWASGSNPTCSACHDAAALPASGHFDNLDSAVVEGDPVATLLASLNYDNTTDPANPTCTDVAGCHSGTRVWGAGSGAPHPRDGSYRPGTVHGSDAKVNLANCQLCHATPPSGGPNPLFTVNNIQNKGDESDPAATGCMKCHNADTAHPSSKGATEVVHWYDSVDNSFITHNNAAGNNAATIDATCGLCHPGLAGSVGTVGFDCLYCHVSNPAGDAVGTCTSCHSTPPTGNAVPNRSGVHGKSAHREACSVCHTNDGPDGTVSAANHFTFPIGGNPNFGQANLRPAPDVAGQTMTITQTVSNVTCAGSCHGKNHSDKTWY